MLDAQVDPLVLVNLGNGVRDLASGAGVEVADNDLVTAGVHGNHDRRAEEDLNTSAVEADVGVEKEAIGGAGVRDLL